MQLARHTGQDEKKAVQQPLEGEGRLSVLLQRGNAAILAQDLGNRIPLFPPPHVDGVM